MSFDEVRFPVRISYGAVGGPGFLTNVVSLRSGHERRNQNWSAVRHAWDVAHGVKDRDDMDDLRDFFMARAGRARGFRYFDWADYSATGQVLGTGNGSDKVFQFVKKYTNGSITYTRTIKKLIHDETVVDELGEFNVTVKLDGVTQSSGFTLDEDNGTVTFTSAPAVGEVVSADFYFDVPARFDTDRMMVTIDQHELMTWGNIPVVELRL